VEERGAPHATEAEHDHVVRVDGDLLPSEAGCSLRPVAVSCRRS
jgi:hypothetical protein